ncbi:MAG: tRNA-dihydrouridine synthase family protein, partial [Candidatus Moranbacteria bacterium]|nr:tRNA-dihydrouridine synthase family protein [Candidatus Moranbacteria bacterium]
MLNVEEKFMPRIKVALAPMAGVTDSAFRLMNKLGGADLVYSEMAHVNAISHNSEKVLAMLKASPYEFPYVVQLFGKDPKYFAQAAKIISERGTPVMRYKPFGKGQIEFIERLLGQLTVYGLRFTAFYSRFLNFQNKSKTGNRELGTRNWKLGTKYCIPSGLDINLGCPARKVFGHGGGAALWKDLKNVRAILE